MTKQIYEQSVQNARIDLNLVNNRVKFDYPTRKYSKAMEWISVAGILFFYYILFLGAAFIGYSAVSIPGEMATLSGEIAIEATPAVTYGVLFQMILSATSLFGILFGIPLTAAGIMVFYKRDLLKYFPKLAYFYNRLNNTFYLARFENIKKKVVEIPLFKNVILNYKATEEYAKYIKRIVITEHPFMRVVRKHNGSVVRPNEYIWKAIITFSKVPKKGRLDVYFI